MDRFQHYRLTVAGLHFCLLSGLLASDLTGTWIGTIPKEGRRPAKDVAFQFVRQGNSLSGKAYNDSGTSDAIISGHVSDAEITFEIEAMEQSGNQINVVLYRFYGSIDGTGIELTREKAAARDASSGAEVPVRRAWDSDKQDRARRFRSFRLERLTR